MKRWQKLTSILLVVVITFGMASCGGKKDEATDKPSSTTPASSATDTPNSDNATDDNNGSEADEDDGIEEQAAAVSTHFSDNYEAQDMGGRVITYCGNWGTSTEVDENVYPDEADGNFEARLLGYENRARVESKYNVRTRWINIPYSDLTAQLSTSVLAGSPMCDILNTEGEGMIGLIANGFVMPTSEYMTPNADALTSQLSTMLGVETFGDTYYFQNVPYVNIESWYLLINQDIIRSLGVANPVDLYNEGAWTFDAFLEIAKAATKSTDGTGIINQWGLGGAFGIIMDCVLASNGGMLFDLANEQQGISNPKSVNALNFLQKLIYDEKVWYWPQDGNWWDWDLTRDAYKDGKIAMAAVTYWVLQQKGDLTYDWNIVSFPKGPDNTEETSFFTGVKGLVIPRGVKDPQLVYQVYEELANWYGEQTEYAVDEASISWIMDLFNTYEDFERMLDIGAKGGKTDFGGLIPNYDTGAVFGAIIGGEMTVAQAIEAHKDRMQAAADTLFNSIKQ